MKLVKKSLLVASTLALGLTITGCSKKSSMMTKSNTYKFGTNYSLNNLEKKFSETVKSVNYASSRFIRYTNTNDETVFYDFVMDKVVFKTSEKVISIYPYLDNTALLITYDDEKQTKEVVMTNGKVLVERGEYLGINVYSTRETYSYKEKNYKEFYAVINKHQAGEYTLDYYKVTIKGIKNSDKDLIMDKNPDGYEIVSATADEIKKYKAGDNVLADNDSYSYGANGNYINFYNQGSRKTKVQLSKSSSASYKIYMNESTGKALVQFRESTSNTNYDISIGGNKYLLDTYLVDTKAGTYKKLDNFKYYFFGDQESSYDVAGGTIVYNVGYIVDNMVPYYINIFFDGDYKVSQDDQTYAYGTSYRDLGTGYYLTIFNGANYLTDKSGKIKKIFKGNVTYLKDAKVIALNYNNKLSFIDFKGNYITEDYIAVSGTPTAINGKTLYYTAVDGSKHVIDFENSKLIRNEEVEYTLGSASTDITSASNAVELRMYNSANNDYFYFIDLIDNNGDNYKEAFTLTFYDKDVKEIGKIENVISSDYTSTYNSEGKDCNFYFVYEYNDDVDTYKIAVYELNQKKAK